MKRLTIAVAFGALLAMGAAGGADAPKAKPWAKAKKDLSVKGRFHQLHIKGEKLDCDDCHTKEPEDILFLRLNDAPPALKAGEEDPGQWGDRKGCLTCHKPGDVENTYWGVLTK